MTELSFKKPGGTAYVDTNRVLIDTEGNVWICSGSPVNHNLKPADPEEVSAMNNHFGASWKKAITAMKAIRD